MKTKRTRLEINGMGDIVNLTSYAESAAQWVADATSCRMVNSRLSTVRRELEPVFRNWVVTTRTMNQIRDLARMYGMDW